MLNGTSKRMGSGIRGLKRDTELMILVGFLNVCINYHCRKTGCAYDSDRYFQCCCFLQLVLESGRYIKCAGNVQQAGDPFAIITLVGLNGIHKKTWAALFYNIDCSCNDHGESLML